MATIDLSNRQYILCNFTDIDSNIIVIEDETTNKKYLLRVDNGKITLTNIADDTEVLNFSPDA